MSTLKLRTSRIEDFDLVTLSSKAVAKHLSEINDKVLNMTLERCKEKYISASIFAKIGYNVFGKNSKLYQTELANAYSEIHHSNYSNYTDYQAIFLKLQEFIADTVLNANTEFVLTEKENELITKLFEH